jgi:citrate synthase
VHFGEIPISQVFDQHGFNLNAKLDIDPDFLKVDDHDHHDPRAAALLALFEPSEVISRFIAKVTSLTGLQPNIDAALAALVARYRLPADAAFGLFATARSVGLLAHSIEQLSVAQVIRPRGRYVGIVPDVLSNNRTMR